MNEGQRIKSQGHGKKSRSNRGSKVIDKKNIFFVLKIRKVFKYLEFLYNLIFRILKVNIKFVLSITEKHY